MAYRSTFGKKNVSQCIENLLVQGRGFSAFFKPWPYIQAHSTSRLQMCRRIFCSPCSSKDLLTESYGETQRMSWELAQRLQGAPDTWRGPQCTWQNKSTSTEGRSAPGNGFQPRHTLCPGKLHPKDPEIENPDVSGIGSQALALVMVPQHGFNCFQATLCSWQPRVSGKSRHSSISTRAFEGTQDWQLGTDASMCIRWEPSGRLFWLPASFSSLMRLFMHFRF